MSNFKGVSCALISSSTFGLIPLFSIPLIMSGMLILSILFYRFLFSALMLLLLCLVQRKSFKISVKQFWIVFGLSFFYAATALGLIYSYQMIPSGVATTIHFLYPVVVAFLMVVFFHEQKSSVLFIAAFISLAGVALLSWSGDSTLNIFGVLCVISTVLTYAIYIVGVNQSGVERIDSFVLTFYILFFGAIQFGLYSLFTNNIGTIPDLTSLYNLLLLALFPTVISDWTLILGIKYAGSTITSILGSMEPLVAVVVGIFYFHEDFGIHSFFGLSLVLVSVALVLFFKQKQTVSI